MAKGSEGSGIANGLVLDGKMFVCMDVDGAVKCGACGGNGEACEMAKGLVCEKVLDG